MGRSTYIALTVFLLIIGLVMSCFFSDRSAEFAKYDSAQYKRVDLHYQLQGSHDTTLVFIHDWNLNHSYWNDYVSKLKSRYKILTLDLAGHGDSGKDRTQWTSESFARDIINVFEKEKINNAILIGHSLGADVALQVHAFKPESVVGIIGVESLRNVEFHITEDFVDGMKEELSQFKRNYPERADEFARKNIRSKNRDVINRIVADYKNADPKIALAIYKNMAPSREQEKEQLQSLPFKIQIIASDYAPIDERALKKYARSGYEIEWVHDAGHFPMVEQPFMFQQALEKSLARIQRPLQ